MTNEARKPDTEWLRRRRPVFGRRFVLRASDFFRISSFGFRILSNLHRKRLLFLRLFQLVFPLLDAAVCAAEREEFFLVVNHFITARAGERIILLQENGLLRADFLAKAAENAAEHVD